MLTFLTRIAFLLGDSTKDPDAPALLKHSLSLLDDALVLWPSIPVKMNFLNRMLETNLQQNLDPPPSLIIGDHHHLNIRFWVIHRYISEGFNMHDTLLNMQPAAQVQRFVTRHLQQKCTAQTESPESLAFPCGVVRHALGLPAGLQVWR